MRAREGSMNSVSLDYAIIIIIVIIRIYSIYEECPNKDSSSSVGNESEITEPFKQMSRNFISSSPPTTQTS